MPCGKVAEHHGRTDSYTRTRVGTAHEASGIVADGVKASYRLAERVKHAAVWICSQAGESANVSRH
jgi:hypothetical protein